MKKLFLLLAIGVFASILTACATVMRENSQIIPLKANVTASKDGFKTHTTVIDWHVSGWYWAGNFVIGGLIGYLIIDPITGDMYYLDEEVNLNMSPVRK